MLGCGQVILIASVQEICIPPSSSCLSLAGVATAAGVMCAAINEDCSSIWKVRMMYVYVYMHAHTLHSTPHTGAYAMCCFTACLHVLGK